MANARSHFYVYHHMRADTGDVFYVGKGKGRRAYEFGARRSLFWNNVCKKAGGVVVKIIAHRLSEFEAFFLEKRNIAALRAAGANLCNMTDGGDGVSGYKRTQEFKDMMSALHKNKPKPPDVRAKISASVKSSGFVHTEEMRKKISDANKGKQRSLGYKHTDRWIEASKDWKRGNKSRTGQTRLAEERAKASASLSGRVQGRLECPHCLKVGGNAMRRWHFDNCKELEGET